MADEFVTHRYLNGVIIGSVSLVLGSMIGFSVFMMGFVERYQESMVDVVTQYGKDIDQELLVFQNRISENQARALSAIENVHTAAIGGLAARIETVATTTSGAIGRVEARQIAILGDLTAMSRGQVSARMRREIAEQIVLEALESMESLKPSEKKGMRRNFGVPDNSP